MRSSNARDRVTVDINMTPMIDVTFLLIIFFLVSSHLAQQEVQMELELPSAETGSRSDDQTRRVVVNVLPQGTILTGGKRVDPGELQRIIEFERQRVGENLEVRIRADRHVPYRVVEPIMIAAARAGVWRVTFAVSPRERTG